MAPQLCYQRLGETKLAPVDESFYSAIAEEAEKKFEEEGLKKEDEIATRRLEEMDLILAEQYSFSIRDPDTGKAVVADLCAVSLYDQAYWKISGGGKSRPPNKASVRRALGEKGLALEALTFGSNAFFHLFVHEEEQPSFAIPESDYEKLPREVFWKNYEKFAFHPTEVAEGTFYYFFQPSSGRLGSIFLRPPKISSGRGGDGATRSDDVYEVDDFWMGNKALGVALDLYQRTYIECEPEGYEKQLQKLLDGGYVLVNLPRCNEFSIGKNVTRKTASTLGTNLLWGSEILYLKMFDPKSKRKNLPKDPEPPRLYPIKKSILKNNPTATYVLKQKGSYEKTAVPETEKEKESKPIERPRSEGIHLLSGNVYERKDAKSVMGSSAREATELALKNLMVQGQWEKEDRRKGKLRTDQEWCHLWGHGDGGQEIPGNFVAGSKHCNTEQLAMELGHRTARSQLELKDVRLKVTAYLFHDPENEELPQVGRWMRYKLYLKGLKIFDHVYDAQSESFNYYEFKILKTTIERAVMEGAGGLELYTVKINEQLERLREARGNAKKDSQTSRRSDVSEKLTYNYNPEIALAISKLLAKYAFGQNTKEEEL